MSDYSATFPSQRPVFTADFSNGSKIDPRATFSRASTGSYFGTAKHLASENLLTPSTPDASWTRARLSPTYSQTGPYTGANATLHTEQAITNTAYIGSANYVTVANTSYTYSVWVKQNTGSRNYYQLRVGGLGAGVPFVTYHLSGAGSIDEFGGSYLDSYSITAGPTGWYKLTMTITPTSAATTTYFFLCVAAPSGGEIPSITGDTGNSFLVFGAQVSSTGESVLNETTTSIHRQYASTLKSVSTAGQPRFEYGIDGQSAGTSLGILVEGQSTNLLNYSEQFDNGYWTKSNTTVTANAAVAPSGELTADLITADQTGGSTSHNCSRPFAFTSGNTYTLSVFAKAAGYNKLWLYRGNPATWEGVATFELTGSGTVSNVTGSASIESVGNGWYRCSVTGTAGATASTSLLFGLDNGDGTLVYDGDDYSGVLLYGAMMEQASHSSSYLKVEGSTATRAADSLSVATADIPGFSEGVGTIVCETGGVASSTAVNQLAFGLNGPASSNLFSAGVNNGGVTDSTVRVYSQTPDGDQAFLNPGTATVGTGYKLAVRYELDNIAASMNGGAVVSDTNGKVPVGIDTLWVGELEGNYHLNSNLKRIAVYNEALSDTNLISLTS